MTTREKIRTAILLPIVAALVLYSQAIVDAITEVLPTL